MLDLPRPTRRGGAAQGLPLLNYVFPLNKKKISSNVTDKHTNEGYERIKLQPFALV